MKSPTTPEKLPKPQRIFVDTMSQLGLEEINPKMSNPALLAISPSLVLNNPYATKNTPDMTVSIASQIPSDTIDNYGPYHCLVISGKKVIGISTINDLSEVDFTKYPQASLKAYYLSPRINHVLHNANLSAEDKVRIIMQRHHPASSLIHTVLHSDQAHTLSYRTLLVLMTKYPQIIPLLGVLNIAKKIIPANSIEQKLYDLLKLPKPATAERIQRDQLPYEWPFDIPIIGTLYHQFIQDRADGSILMRLFRPSTTEKVLYDEASRHKNNVVSRQHIDEFKDYYLDIAKEYFLPIKNFVIEKISEGVKNGKQYSLRLIKIVVELMSKIQEIYQKHNTK